MFRLLRSVAQTRRTIKLLDRLTQAAEQQNVLLARLADHFAPLISSSDDLVSTGASFVRNSEQADILAFIDRFMTAKGTEPTEEEILDYLQERDRPH